MVTRFLDVVLESDARRLTRDGTVLRLSPKAFDLLSILVAARPAAITKAELLERVWPGTFVTDASLARAVHEIRDVLGTSGSTAIRTVHGYGYAFGADAVSSVPPRSTPASEAADRPPAAAWLLCGSRAIPLMSSPVLIGRDPAADVPIESLLASWHHARLDVQRDAATIHDLGSKNGTTVRGSRIAGPTAVADGDEIGIAGLRFVLRRGTKALPTETAGT